jgi:hypothetical protein
MTDSSLDKELGAIKSIAAALEALDAPTRERVLKYAMDHMGIPTFPGTGRASGAAGTGGAPDVQTESPPRATQQVADIRTLKDQKNPQSDTQMAALVAYYLAELAPDDRRKDAISTSDIVNYFKQANYELPEQPKDTLPRAKAGGYFDRAGRGRYKLNPVGHNLVVHNLPAQAGPKAPRTSRRKERAKVSANKHEGAKPKSYG